MNIIQILEHLSNFSYVPVTYFKNGQNLFHFPDLPYLEKLTALVPEKLLTSEKNADCLLTDELMCIGIIKTGAEDSYVILGPISALPCDNRRAQQILKKYGLPTTQTGDLLSYFGDTPNYSLSKFANLVIFANYVLNRETIDILDLLPDEYHANDVEPQPIQQHIVSDMDVFHSGLSFEKQLYSYIKYGKQAELADFISHFTFSGNEGLLANDIFRHRKNMIICSTTMASRAALDGGLDYESAMRYADFFMQKVEMAPDTKYLAQLHHNMLKTYARLVSVRKLGNPNSATAAKVYNYVEQHINVRIHAEEIAQALGISRSYLCLQFKKETGMNLNDFISKAKIDEAKRMLTTTDNSAVSIASLLDFSSQSYFQAIFKKYTDLTPKEYREKNNI